LKYRRSLVEERYWILMVKYCLGEGGDIHKRPFQSQNKNVINEDIKHYS
jgi:hypothetical protein